MSDKTQELDAHVRALASKAARVVAHMLDFRRAVEGCALSTRTDATKYERKVLKHVCRIIELEDIIVRAADKLIELVPPRKPSKTLAAALAVAKETTFGTDAPTHRPDIPAPAIWPVRYETTSEEFRKQHLCEFSGADTPVAKKEQWRIGRNDGNGNKDWYGVYAADGRKTRRRWYNNPDHPSVTTYPHKQAAQNVMELAETYARAGQTYFITDGERYDDKIRKTRTRKAVV